MAIVELRFSALPEHVRTARLVAAAVARRAGVDEAVLDEVRLAVGEACSRAVGLHVLHGVENPVRVALIEEEKKFSIEVGDATPTAAAVQAAAGPEASAPPAGSADDEEAESDMGLAVISGLVDDVEVTADENGGLIRMSWPVTPEPVLP
ncbi:anti-sigma regulatory factor [Streptomyces abyssalis]|uniref:Anti-sigma regulatory factor n=1 Tax=Streptomyces abyssalis TaxID=933944 RepID=A0A1E7JQH6_9ACTN|nr:ATP-binding protein [Streptomyces abyssalis]OEU90516.1 anti-sigma regulatory factor [Streptomyces abyssalis]OEU95255.1 anti-sigma regulatory factor [Streptomyces abyssalis]OEV29592.1 anti-sigma regulatory factor [Streptomyces nanshensis]